MTLTVGHGPLASRSPGQANFTVEAPEHRLLLEDYPYLRGPYVCFLHDEVAVELRDPFPPAAP